MSGSKKQKNLDALPDDLEKAAQPIMDRAQRVKEQVTEATATVKQSVEAKAKVIREKSDRLKEVSEKAVSDAREIVFEQEQPTVRARYALRGGKLFALLAIFFALATICVAILIWTRNN